MWLNICIMLVGCGGNIKKLLKIIRNIISAIFIKINLLIFSFWICNQSDWFNFYWVLQIWNWKEIKIENNKQLYAKKKYPKRYLVVGSWIFRLYLEGIKRRYWKRKVDN